MTLANHLFLSVLSTLEASRAGSITDSSVSVWARARTLAIFTFCAGSSVVAAFLKFNRYVHMQAVHVCTLQGRNRVSSGCCLVGHFVTQARANCCSYGTHLACRA